MQTIKKVKAPVRIDFAGGTTDISPFKDKYGGAVLNATINRYVVGKIIKTPSRVHLEYTGNTPTSSGLGTSGVMNLVWLTLISQIKLKNKGEIKFKDKAELAEGVYIIEKTFGGANGKQDQYAAAFGGINLMEFNKNKVKITRLKLSKKTIKELESKLILVYTGKPHFSGDSNKNAIDNLLKGKNIKNFLAVKKIAYEMKNALLKNDLMRFAELMNKETEERKKFSKATIPLSTENIIKQGKQNGAIAAKVCGSGGGGSILFFGDKEKLKRKFGSKIIDFKFDFDGLKWI